MNIEFIKNKIFDWENLETFLFLEKFKSKKIVFTNGCFDILHRGHIHTLAFARDLGTCLIVGVNSDASVKRLKGSERPINSEMDRALLLASLQCVDAVVIFEEDTPLKLIQKIKPDVLVKGGDYKKEDVVGVDIALETVIIPFVENYSTTSTIEKLKN